MLAPRYRAQPIVSAAFSLAISLISLSQRSSLLRRPPSLSGGTTQEGNNPSLARGAKDA